MKPETSRPPSPASRARPVEWLVLLVASAVLGALASAALVHHGWSPTTALVTAWGATGALLAGAGLHRRRGHGSAGAGSCVLVATVCVAVPATSLLWIGSFRGMPAMGGGDAGDHVALMRAFLAHDAPGQHGMGAFYTLAYWLGKLFGSSPFGAFRAVFYGSVVTTFALLAALCAHLTAGRSGLTPKRLLATWGALTLPPCLLVVLPLHHYYQADGYLPQTLSVTLLVGAAVAGGAIRHEGMRAAALLLALGLLRYSYVLNASEAILASAAVIAWGRFCVAKRTRGLQAAAILLVGAALAVYASYRIRSADHFGASDGIVFDYGFASIAALALLSIAALLVPSCHLGGCRRATQRFAYFIGVLGLTSAAIRLVWRLEAGHAFYYECKLGYAPTIVVALGLSVLIAEGVALHMAKIPTVRSRGPFVGLLVPLGWALASVGALPYWPSFAERVQGRPPFEWLTPLLDERVETVVRERMSDGRHHFGGLLTPRWPESSFTNALFELPRRSWLEADTILRGPGACVFWYAPASLPRSLGYLAGHLRTVRSLEVERTRPCIRFAPADGTASALELCSHCFGEASRAQP